MKFVDEATIWVEAGHGGSGAVSFRREMYAPRGGPDGGDGGHGGSVYLVAKAGLNTLADFRYARRYVAQSGERGSGTNSSGRSGEDLHVAVPVGTLAYDADTGELLGDLTLPNAPFMVARGGVHGIGNARFKSSVNRAPRQSTPGKPGEARHLRLELKLLADVGLLGLPNAGKSTLLRAISAARPKVADYPFTTLYPHLGVVRLGPEQSFVVADVPGLIEGAAEGAGLGSQFLRHLQRTRLLLHLVDLAALDGEPPVSAVRKIEQELRQYNPELAARERWLVFTKIDLLPPGEAAQRAAETVAELAWSGPVHTISALRREGTAALMQAVMQRLIELAPAAGDAS